MLKKIGKKGGIHVDWAISMGLFLVYVILLFIILKPGSYAIHKPESLFTIIENTFINNTQISIREVQFNVKHCIEGREIILEDKNHNYRFSEVKKNEGGVVNLLTKEGGEPEEGISVGDKVDIYCSNEEDGYIAWTGDDEKKFLTTAYPKELKSLTDTSSLPKYDIDCHKSPRNPNAQAAPSGKECKASLGAVTEYTGFYKEYLDRVADKSNNFEQLKKDWGFPLDSFFRIKIIRTDPDPTDNVSPDIEIFDRLNPEPPEGVNVFIKEFDAVMLNKYNEREKIKINILVW